MRDFVAARRHMPMLWYAGCLRRAASYACVSCQTKIAFSAGETHCISHVIRGADKIAEMRGGDRGGMLLRPAPEAHGRDT
jgi:hypothetical protein